MKKAFIDANIILDFLDRNRFSHEHSIKVFELLIDRNYQIAVSEDILTTIYYIVKNKPAVLEFFELILNQWQIESFGKKTIMDAVAYCKKNISLDFEDVVQSLCAKESGCSLIVSNDKNFFNCGVPITNSKEFITGKY